MSETFQFLIGKQNIESLLKFVTHVSACCKYLFSKIEKKSVIM